MGEKKKGGGTDNNKHFPEQGTEDTHLYMLLYARKREARSMIRISTRRTELGSLAMLQELPRTGNPDFQHCRLASSADPSRKHTDVITKASKKFSQGYRRINVREDSSNSLTLGSVQTCILTATQVEKIGVTETELHKEWHTQLQTQQKHHTASLVLKSQSMANISQRQIVHPFLWGWGQR